MKKKLKIFFISMLCFIVIGIQITFLGLGIYILDGLTYLYRHPGLLSEGTIRVENMSIECRVIDIEDNSIIVRPIRDYPKFCHFKGSEFEAYEYEFLYTDELSINLDGADVMCDLEVGKIINVIYKLSDGYTGINPKHFNTVVSIKEVENSEDIVSLKGRSYYKKYLSEETINWLKMSEEERLNDGYYPEDLVKLGFLGMSNEIEEWGIKLKVNNVDKNGLTLICTQEDFIPTELNDDWKITTSSYFVIKKLKNNKWVYMKPKIREKNTVWSLEVDTIKNNSITNINLNWEWLYGSLPKGKYRMYKEIKLLREPGDFDWKPIYVYFEVK